MVVCSVHFLASAFSPKTVICVWRHMSDVARTCEGACVFLVCKRVKTQSLWLMLHVKPKLAPPEPCNTLHLTTTRPEMTAGRAPIPINPYLALYSTHLLSFLPTKASSPSHTRAGFILHYRRREHSLKMREREIFLWGEGGWGSAENEKELTMDH